MVNTIDHLGIGLADLMYAPFGGAKAFDLNTVMQSFTSGTAQVFNWIGFLGVAIGAVVAPFLMLGIILSVLVAIFVGFLTLLFRKIIIILALIFVPVALISWMMPNDGLRQYWKLWWSNFSKALMMFPLIIAVIAGGRIFAKIGSGQADFVGFFIVLVGFFGPLFILPKTFKWGGTAMQLAGNAMTKAQTATLKKPKEFLGERQKGWSAERTRQSQERYLNNEGFNWRRPWRRPVDLVKAGAADPTLWGRRRRQAMDNYVFKGLESEETDLKAANARAQNNINRLRSDDQDPYARALAAGQKVEVGRDGRIIATRYRADAAGNFVDAAGNIIADSSGRFAAGRGAHDLVVDANGQLHADDQGRITGAIDATKATDIERRAGIDQTVRLGGDGNIQFLHRTFERELTSNDPEKITAANRALTAHVGTLFDKMPQMYKNPDYLTTHDVARTINGIGAEELRKLSAPSFTTMLNQTQLGGDAASENRLVGVYLQTMNDINRRGSVAPEINREMFRYASTLPATDPRRDEILRHTTPDGTLNPLP